MRPPISHRRGAFRESCVGSFSCRFTRHLLPSPFRSCIIYDARCAEQALFGSRSAVACCNRPENRREADRTSAFSYKALSETILAKYKDTMRESIMSEACFAGRIFVLYEQNGSSS